MSVRASYIPIFGGGRLVASAATTCGTDHQSGTRPLWLLAQWPSTPVGAVCRLAGPCLPGHWLPGCQGDGRHCPASPPDARTHPPAVTTLSLVANRDRTFAPRTPSSPQKNQIANICLLVRMRVCLQRKNWTEREFWTMLPPAHKLTEHQPS